MSHSKEQMRQKAEARHEALDHARHSTVFHPRNGMDHEAHKQQDMREDDKERGNSAGDMSTGDRNSMGY